MDKDGLERNGWGDWVGKWMADYVRLSWKCVNVNVNANAIHTSQFVSCLVPFHRTIHVFFYLQFNKEGQEALRYLHYCQCYQEVVSLGTSIVRVSISIFLSCLLQVQQTKQKKTTQHNINQYKQQHHCLKNQIFSIPFPLNNPHHHSHSYSLEPLDHGP